MFPGVALGIIPDIGGRIGSSVDCDDRSVGLSVAAPDVRGRAMARLRTARRVAEEEAAFFSDLKLVTYVALSYMDDPDVWHEALVTWPSLGVDRAAAILTPDDDQ